MGKIYAVRMREYNKGEGCLRRSWAAGRWGINFTAGDSTPRRPFRPSPIVEVTKEQYEYIMGRRPDGLPNVGQPHNAAVPVFQGWIVDSRRELAAMVQKEVDARAASGTSNARAMLRLQGPLEAEKPVEAMIPQAPKEPVKPEPEPEPEVEEKEPFAPLDVDVELAKAEMPEHPHSADLDTVDNLEFDDPGTEEKAEGGDEDKSDDSDSSDDSQGDKDTGKEKAKTPKKTRGRPPGSKKKTKNIDTSSKK